MKCQSVAVNLIFNIKTMYKIFSLDETGKLTKNRDSWQDMLQALCDVWWHGKDVRYIIEHSAHFQCCCQLLLHISESQVWTLAAPVSACFLYDRTPGHFQNPLSGTELQLSYLEPVKNMCHKPTKLFL